ncbi:uncharacterized protein LOC132735955 [Ruditapes philippinarum]|uniref:uncharacterized protein LOC132735955 n=1 Tax=Ruditapes philippinarum TaxID=129788 RepID=UPI00295B9B41|nr:uncharacterized protein LOC132735955 [Ruditapes philippinarum]
MTSTSTAIMTTSMPTSSRSSVSSSSKYYGKTASKVTFSTTSQQNIHVQPTTDKTTTFSSTSVITGRVSSSAANPITASLSTSHEMSHSTNFTAKDISKNEWVRINDKLLLVVEQEESFPSARNTCMNMGAELLAYSNPMRFFQPSIDKILKNNSYWLGVYYDKLDMECPILYNKNNISSFQLANCSNNNQFICSKSSNVTDEAESLEFEEMLKDMTVERLKTSKTKRKLVSARDKRKSSKSIGASGIFIICAVIAFFVLIDINWRQCHFVRRNA